MVWKDRLGSYLRLVFFKTELLAAVRFVAFLAFDVQATDLTLIFLWWTARTTFLSSSHTTTTRKRKRIVQRFGGSRHKPSQDHETSDEGRVVHVETDTKTDDCRSKLKEKYYVFYLPFVFRFCVSIRPKVVSWRRCGECPRNSYN